MELLRAVGDVGGLVAFAIAIALVIPAKVERSDWMRGSLKYTLIATLAVYFLVGVSDTLGNLGLAEALEFLEDYTESLYPVLALFVVFIMFASQQYADAVRSQNALASTHALMMDVVDGVVAGILFLDDAGNIAFANAAAKEALDLVESPTDGRILTPDWASIEIDGQRSNGLGALVGSRSYKGRSLTFVWDTGWRLPIYVSGRPLHDAGGGVGGFVLSFELPTPTS